MTLNFKLKTFPGKFIVIEGLDGSGKSSQVELLTRFLEDQGKTVVLRSEPTKDSEAGLMIRRILKGEVQADAMERQRLFVQDRKEHLEKVIIPALCRGEYVVCSRYLFSTLAYGYSDGLDIEVLKKMNTDFLIPDITLLIDVSPDECIRRIEARGEAKELFEKKEKLVKVNEVYQQLPRMFPSVVVINGEQSLEATFEQIKHSIKKIV